MTKDIPVPVTHPKYSYTTYIDARSESIMTVMGKVRTSLSRVHAPPAELEAYEDTCAYETYRGVLITSAKLFRLIDESGRLRFVYMEP